MEDVSIEVIKTPEKFIEKISVEEAMDFLNSLVEEGALIIRNKKATLREENIWYRKQLKGLEKEKVVHIYALEGKRIIGNCDVRKGSYREEHNVEFGLAVRKEYRRKGYGELLLRKGIEEAINTLKAKKMWISYIEGNEPARKLYEKVGFREVCRLKGYVRVGEEYRDRVFMEYKK